jgi:FdhD protein
MSDFPAAFQAHPEWRVRAGAVEAGEAALAVEVPVALEFNGVAHAVMLATPADLEDFALGFSLSEGILGSPSELYGVEVRNQEGLGITLSLEVASRAFTVLKAQRRNLAGRTGCGLCGTEQLDQVLRPLPPARLPEPGNAPLAPAVLVRALAAMEPAQALGRQTGATHAAAWFDPQGALQALREDVGRHNALDKLLGALARAGRWGEPGFVVVSSRASVEMVQKSAMAGVQMLVAVSAPTALAARLAQDQGMTLVGFARGERFAVYTHPQRLMQDVPESP